MKNYKVHGFQATIASGIMRLADVHAKPRIDALKLIGRVEEHKLDPKADEKAKAAQAAALPKVGDYEVKSPVNFKRLQEFGWDGKATRLQESQQFAELRQANTIIAEQDAKRMEKQKNARDTSSRDPRAQRGNLR